VEFLEEIFSETELPALPFLGNPSVSRHKRRAGMYMLRPFLRVLATPLLPLVILVVVALAGMPAAIVLFVARLVVAVTAFVPSVLAFSRR
jgi:hypothetical protein